MAVPQVQNHLSARSLLRRRLTQASLLPSFIGRLRSFEIQHAKIVKPGPFERDRVLAIWYSADRTRRSPGPHPRAVVSLVRGPRAFLPKTTSIRSPSTDEPAIHDDDHVRRAERSTLASIVGRVGSRPRCPRRAANDAPPPPSPWSLYPCSRSSVPVALSSSPLPAPPGPQDP